MLRFRRPFLPVPAVPQHECELAGAAAEGEKMQQHLAMQGKQWGQQELGAHTCVQARRAKLPPGTGDGGGSPGRLPHASTPLVMPASVKEAGRHLIQENK